MMVMMITMVTMIMMAVIAAIVRSSNTFGPDIGSMFQQVLHVLARNPPILQGGVLTGI